MTSKKHLIELIVFFIAFPIFLAIPQVSIQVKLISSLIPIGFIIFKSIQHKQILFKRRKQIKPTSFWKNVAYRSILIILITFIYLKFTDPSSLFIAVRTKPFLWIKMIFVYTFASVIPQEFIYRTFFFHQYEKLTQNSNKQYLLNAFIFSIAHLMFYNGLILLLTFAGGYIFSDTYAKTKSLFWVCLEHAIYGSLLFTMGLGKALGFPV